MEDENFLMDSHPYSYETSIFTLGAPHDSHEEVHGRQTKLVQPFPLEIPTLFFPNSLDNVLRNFFMGQWT